MKEESDAHASKVAEEDRVIREAEKALEARRRELDKQASLLEHTKLDLERV